MYKLLALETPIRICPTSEFKNQGYRDGKPMVGVIAHYHNRILRSGIKVGDPVPPHQFCYMVKWPNGDLYGYRSMDVIQGSINNDSMVHVLHKNQ